MVSGYGGKLASLGGRIYTTLNMYYLGNLSQSVE